MPNATWPTTLPMPTVAGSSIEPAVDNIIKSSMENGPAKRRRRFTWVPDTFQTQLSLTGDQVEVLNDFVKTTLKDVLPFDWVDPVTGAAKTWVFTKRPSYTPDDTHEDLWTAALSLESKP